MASDVPRLLSVSILAVLCAGCMVPEERDIPLVDPAPPEAEPSRLRANIEKIGEDLSPAVLKTVLNDLIRAGRHAEPLLYEALTDPTPRRRSNALYVLRYSSNLETPSRIAPLLEDKVVEVSLEAAAVLVELGHKEGIPYLIRGLRHESPMIRENCVQVLRASTSLYFDFNANDPLDRREFCAGKWERWWKEEGASFQLGARRS